MTHNAAKAEVFISKKGFSQMKCCDVSGLLNKHRQERRESVQVEKMKQDITIIIEVNHSSFSSLEIIFS